MALPSIPLSEWQFHCTVCQDVFTNPVSTPCGHNFCKACLSGFWDGSDIYQCPLCKKRFEGPLDLNVNTILVQITQDFKRRRLEAPKVGIKHEVEDSRLPNRTSLSDDEAQSCSTDDLLVDPILNLRNSMCEKHNQPLELFCNTDCTCVCKLCVEDDHGEHATVTVERVWFHRHEELQREVLQVKEDILDRQKKMEEIKRRTRLIREDAEKELQEGLQILSAILLSVEKCQAELKEVIEGKQKAAESRAQSLLDELEQEIRGLKTTKAKVKQHMRCQDHVRLLQSFPSQLIPPCHKDWDNVIIHTDLSVGTVRSVLAPHEENFRGKLRELMDAEFKKIRHYADDVTLDPLGKHWTLDISKDRKKVGKMIVDAGFNFHHNKPEQLDPGFSILGEQMFSSGRHYWEVQVEGKISCYLGVAMVSISREKKTIPLPRNGLWLLELKQGEILKALNVSPVELRLSSGLKKVGVYVDYEAGQISFYNVESRSHIFSFTGNTFTENLCLFLNPKSSDKVPMILSPVTQA